MKHKFVCAGACFTVALSACSSTAAPRALARPGSSTTVVVDGTTTTVAPRALAQPGSSTTVVVDGTTTTVAEPTSAVVPIASFGVGSTEITFVDKSRPTPANKTFAGVSSRTLHAFVWYPSSAAPTGGPIDGAQPDRARGPYPLVIFSHGVTGTAAVYQGTGIALASSGYVVITPDYPLSNLAAPGGATTSDVKQQPADASFVLDQILASQDARFKGLIDRNHIGAAGHSLGAITTLGLTFAKCCADHRIQAAVSLAGAVFGIDDAKNYFTGTAVPVLFFHGDADATVPYSASVSAYAAAKSPKAFITVPGGPHWGAWLGSTDSLVPTYHKALVAWFDRWLKLDVNAFDRVRTAVKNSLGKMTLQEQLR